MILELLGPLLGFKETDREHVGEREKEISFDFPHKHSLLPMIFSIKSEGIVEVMSKHGDIGVDLFVHHIYFCSPPPSLTLLILSLFLSLTDTLSFSSQDQSMLFSL